MGNKICELCQDEASVHCASDSAFLCFACDAKVHGANFLVARHVRRPICSTCGSLANLCFSGAGAGGSPAICRTCCGTDEELNRDDSSSCISGTVVSAPRKRRNRICSSSSVTEGGPERFSGGEVEWRRNNRRSGRWQGGGGMNMMDPKAAEGVLVIWFRRLGLSEGESIDRAHRALGLCNGRFTVMPLRVLLAAASGESRRMEEVSGVPRKLILALQAKLARVNNVGPSDLEEGWAECSP